MHGITRVGDGGLFYLSQQTVAEHPCSWDTAVPGLGAEWRREGWGEGLGLEACLQGLGLGL